MADQNLAALPWEILSIFSEHGTGTATENVTNHSIFRALHCSLTDYSAMHPLPSVQLPFLLSPHHDRDPRQPTHHIGNLFSLPFNPLLRSYSDLTHLRNTQGCICVSSSHGWLITLGRDSSVCLLNPVTAESLPLHPLSSLDHQNLSFHYHTFPEYHLMQNNIWHSQSSIVRRAVLSSDPAEDRNFTLLLFISDGTNWCYTWSARDGPWIRHLHHPFLVEDVISFNGMFVAIDRRNHLVFFDFRNRNTGLVLIWCIIHQELPSGDVFLVNSDGRLLIVSTLDFHYPSRYIFPRGYIKIFQFPVDEIPNRAGTCMQVMELRDHALFLGHGCSVSVSVRRVPQLTRDAVYFTHVYYKLELVVEGGERTVVALNQGAVFQNIVSAGTMSESNRVFDVENSQFAGLWNGRRPFWVAPEINHYVLYIKS